MNSEFFKDSTWPRTTRAITGYLVLYLKACGAADQLFPDKTVAEELLERIRQERPTGLVEKVRTIAIASGLAVAAGTGG